MDCVILLGHGSRAPGAAADIEAVAAGLAGRHPALTVRVAHLELCQPDLAGAVAALAAAGASRVTVLPYLLSRGRHLRDDVPALLRELGQRHPGLALVLGPHLGCDEAMVDLVDRRLAQARSADPAIGH